MYELEADVLNMALFGMTAKEWCDANPDLKGNIRNYANVSLYIANACLEKAKSQIYLDVLLKILEKQIYMLSFQWKLWLILTTFVFENERMVSIVCKYNFYRGTNNGIIR